MLASPTAKSDDAAARASQAGLSEGMIAAEGVKSSAFCYTIWRSTVIYGSVLQLAYRRGHGPAESKVLHPKAILTPPTGSASTKS